MFHPWVGKIPGRRKWQPTPVLLPGKSHGRRSLVGCSPWGLEESDTTERLHVHFSLSCIGEGNGNPLQCSCLENPRVGGAWWAAVYGVTQSRIRLKWLSSSSSRKWLEYINKSNIWNKCPNMISRRSPRIMQITSSRFHFLLWWLGLIYLRMLPNKTNNHENDCSKANSLCYNCHLFY